MDSRYCRPEKTRLPNGRFEEYSGWHEKRLKRYETEEEARRVADYYGCSVFWCEYGRCWHISSR